MLGINPKSDGASVERRSWPVKQKKWSFTLERRRAMTKKVNKLVNFGFIREVTYLDWLVNVILIKKVNGK